MGVVGISMFIGSFFCLLGAIFGSAVTALSWRLPRGESWAEGRSRCPSCGHTLGPLELVPVLSWALSRGRCRHCGARVSIRYPLIDKTQPFDIVADPHEEHDLAALSDPTNAFTAIC